MEGLKLNRGPAHKRGFDRSLAGVYDTRRASQTLNYCRLGIPACGSGHSLARGSREQHP